MSFLPRTLSDDDKELLSKHDAREVSKMTKAIVHAFIVLNQKRLPIKKPDLIRLGTQDNAMYYKTANALLVNASKELYKTFGFRVFMLEDKVRFLLVSTNSMLNTMIQEPESTQLELSLLFLVLVAIFASPIDRVNVEKMNLELAESIDIRQAELSSYMDLFTKRMYLQIEKYEDVKHYIWGPRAYAEVNGKAFFDNFLKLGGYQETGWPHLIKKLEKLKLYEDDQ